MQQINLPGITTEFRNMLIKTRYMEAKFCLQKSIRELVKQATTGNTNNILDLVFICSEAKRKYLQADKG